MKWLMSFILLSVCYLCCYSQKEADDDKTHCQKFDFQNNFNISAENSVVVVYNAANCKRCLQKIYSFRALQHRFHNADYKDLIFIIILNEPKGTAHFVDMQQKAGNVELISLHDVNNDYFLAGTTYVFDKCSHLTYELLPLTYEVQIQIVKAAVLSTWYDSLCGKCQFEEDDGYYEDISEADGSPESIAEINLGTDETNSIRAPEDNYEDIDDLVPEEGDTSYIVPLRVIVPLEHIHEKQDNRSYTKFNFMVLNSNNSAVHSHLNEDKTEVLFDSPPEDNNTVVKQTPSTDELNKILYSKDRTKFEVVKEFTSNEVVKNGQFKEVAPVKNAVGYEPSASEKNETESQNQQNLFISTLHSWLSFRLLNRF